MSNISSLVKKHDFHFSKKYGQNFIGDTVLLEGIVDDAQIGSEDVVLEIGPGAGTLTKALCNRAKKVIAYEIDKSLEPVLNDTLKGIDNVEIIFADVMEVSEEEIKSVTGGKFKIVANLPYYITTPILFKFLSSSLDIESITVMVQKEVAERICASNKTSDYGALTVSVGVRSKAQYMRTVLRDMFTPPPAVDSAIVRMDIKKRSDVSSYEKLDALIKSAFLMKRKTLVNNLSPYWNKSKSEVGEILQSVGISATARAEELSFDQFVILANLQL